MKNKPTNKTLTGKTGKDLLKLIQSKGNAISNHARRMPETESELKLFNIWKNVLGHEDFGLDDDFFQIGGSSIKGIQLLSRIHKTNQVQLALTDIFLHPSISSLLQIIDERKKGVTSSSFIKKQPKPENIPLSFSQERLWFIDRLEGSLQYHIPAVLKLKGCLNISALEFALKQIIRRHEVLRSVFIEKEGKIYQQVTELNKSYLNIIDGTELKSNPQRIDEKVNELVLKPFDLQHDTMLRADLISLTQDEHCLVVTIHHIASDGWSVPIIIEELVELYSSFTESRKENLPEITLQYSDYSIWQRNYLESELDTKIKYWKQKLDGALPLELPTDFTRPAIRKTSGNITAVEIDKELSDKIIQLSADEGSTLYMTLLAAFNVLLFNYSKQNDISVGTSIANRPQLELEGLIGFFVNTLTLRSQVDPNEKFVDFLKQIKTTTIEAYEHQDVPFERVVEAVVRERDQSRSPLFQVMLVLLNTPESESSELKLKEVDIELQDFNLNISKFDLTFHVRETPLGLKVSAEYSTDLFKESTIQRMLFHFTRILDQITRSKDQKVGEIDLMDFTHRQKVLVNGRSEVTFDKDKSLVSLFEQHASITPNNVALFFGEKSMTYQELNEQSNRVAHFLQSKGVGSQSPVLLYMERGIQTFIGMMGILKSGAAYVPIDMDIPMSRIEYIIRDTGAKYLLSDNSSAQKIQLNQIAVINIATELAADLPTNNISITPIDSNDLAYIIYTSGSTGAPKGVMIEHGNLLDYVYGLDKRLEINLCKSYALVSSIATDLGNTVIFSSLVFGGTLHVFSKESISNAEYLQNYFIQNAIDCLKIVPSHWQALSEQNPLLPNKLLIFGGESLSGETIRKIRETQTRCRVINHYGPTETTIGKLLFEADLKENYSTTVPIGKPFGNTRVYVISSTQRLNPIGIPGELYIGGEGLARGYINQIELTQEKFIKNPIEDYPSRIYATGDLVKYLEDGNIEYLGRVDDQVKIRGYRVEPLEIERITLQSELVNMASIAIITDSTGNKNLSAYVVPNQNYSREKLNNYLKQQLPDYMVPSQVIELEKFPMLPNGKIDKKSLPDPEKTTTSTYIAPQSEAQKKMAEIWEDILEVEQVGIHDDFFALGGHSLLAIRLVSAIRKAFKIEMPIGDIFDYPTINLLLPKLQNQSATEVLPPIKTVIPKPDKIPLSFSQERLWFVDQLEGSVQYHVPSVFKLIGNLNIKSIEYSLKGIINRHEVLRTIIREDGGRGYQIIKDANDWKIEIVSNDEIISDQNKLNEFILDLINSPFDLSSDYMLRSHLISLSPKEHILIVTLHHISSDRWSTSIMVKELIELYSAYSNKIQPDLKPLPLQYSDYAIWQRTNLNPSVLDKKLDYWKKKLSGMGHLQLPLDYPRTAVWSVKGAVIPFSINKGVSEGLVDMSQKNGTTLFMTLLSAFKVLLHRYSSQNDICVGTSIANRQYHEIENLIGFFVNTLALRTEVNGHSTFTELLQKVKTTTLEAYEHQDAPFEKVVDSLVTERDMSRNALFQILFVMHNTPEVPKLNVSDLELIDITFPHEVSRFDFTIAFTETENGLQGTIQYCTDLFKEETMKRLIGHFQNILNSVVNDPTEKIGKLSMLDPKEIDFLTKSLLLDEFTYPINKSIVDLFEDQVDKTPQNVAVKCDQDSITYLELDQKANQLANQLLQKGIKAEMSVPVYLERGIDMMISVLGILKAGGLYLPIDTEFPKERVGYMLKDSNAKFVISNADSRLALTDSNNFEVIEINNLQNQSKQRPHIGISSDQLAYIIYTSGSTGQPKGVMISHRNLVDYYYSKYNILIGRILA